MLGTCSRMIRRKATQISNRNLKVISSSKPKQSQRALSSCSNPRINLASTSKLINNPSYLQSRHFTSTSSRSNSDQAPSKACPSCSTTSSLETLVCPKCSHLLPIPNEMDLYSLMGLDWRKVEQGGWKVDVKELKNKWRRMMGVSHPDRMGGKSEVSNLCESVLGSCQVRMDLWTERSVSLLSVSSDMHGCQEMEGELKSFLLKIIFHYWRPISFAHQFPIFIWIH